MASLDRLAARRRECLEKIRGLEEEVAEIERQLLQDVAHELAGGRGALTPRQREVLSLVLEQKSNKEIAAMLNLSVRTAKFHVSALLKKFGVASRIELVATTPKTS